MSERMINQFMEMVQIDSESGYEAEFIDYLFKEFETLGAEVVKDSYGNLIAKLPAKGCEGKDPILLSCHADTVQPGKGIKPVLKDGVIRSEGDTILAADDKAGIAEIMGAATYLLENPEIKHGKIRIAFTVDEEVGTGTGLGLSVAYFIITENHGGTLAVESAPGRGAKFIIGLRLAS